MTIGFIGLGNMGASLARAVRQGLPQERLLLANRSPEKVANFVANYGGEASQAEAVLRESDLVFVGIKPHQFQDFLAQYGELLAGREGLTLVSMAAGLPLADLEAATPAGLAWIRIMPNTPVAVGQGVISYTVGADVPEAHVDLFLSALTAAGQLVALPENLLDAATALAGCGPAFVFRFAEALADAGVAAGLPRQIAQDMATQTLLGSAQLLQSTGAHPAQLKDQVCSPGGATIAGVAQLDKAAFSGSVLSAVEAAFTRTQELGKK